LISKRAAYNIGDIYVNVLQPFIPNGLSNLDFVLQIKKVGNTCSMLKNKTQQLANFANFRATYQKEKICVAHFF
jgi:hypothetical protein